MRKTRTDILRAMRYSNGVEMDEAANGREGVDAVVRQRPDLVLLDLQMPGMSGLALLKQIRDVEPRLPVIVIRATSRCSSRRFPTRRSLACRGRSQRLRFAHRAPSAPAADSFRIDARRTSVLLWRGRARRPEPLICTQLRGMSGPRPAGRRLALLREHAGAHADQACPRGG